MRTLLLPLVAAVGLSGCQSLITFSTEQKGEAVIQGNALGALLGAFPQMGGFSNIDFSENQDFKNHNAQRDLVESTKVTSLTLRILSPVDQDFSFLDSIEVAVKAADQEQKIASKTGIAQLNLPPPTPTLALDLVDVDLASYVRASSMTIIVRGTGRQPPQDTRLEASVKLLVGVGLPKGQ